MRNPPFIDRLPNGKPLKGSNPTGLFAVVFLLVNLIVLAKRHITELLGGFIDRRYTVGDGEQYFEVGVAHDVWSKAVSSGKPVIIAVHGTGDGSHEAHLVPTRPRWWQIGSKFSTDVTRQVFSGEATWLPFHWHGANSDTKRHEGSKGLARLCGALSDRKIPYAIVGHSHGGNVIENALLIYYSNMGNIIYCNKIITLGTPYFNKKSNIGRYIQLFSNLFGCIISVLGGVFYYFGWIDILKNENGINLLLQIPYFTVFAFAGTILLSLFFFYLSKNLIEIFRSILSKNKIISHVNDIIFCINYNYDEVVRILPHVVNDKFSFSNRDSEISSIKRFVISIVKLFNIVLFAIFALFLIYCLLLASGEIYELELLNAILNLNYSLDPLLLFYYAAPISFIMTYIITIIFFYAANNILGPLISGLIAKLKDRFVKSIIRSIAYGEDYDFRLISTGAMPQYFKSSLSVIETGYSDRLSNQNYSHFKETAYKLMSGMSEEVAFADTEALVSNLMRAIYHNAYFHDDEVIEMVCDHINKGRDT